MKGRVASRYFRHGKLPATMLVFSAVMSITFFLTFAPAVGPVAKTFGTANMAMLFDVVMLARQVGGFFALTWELSVQSDRQLRLGLVCRHRAGRW